MTAKTRMQKVMRKVHGGIMLVGLFLLFRKEAIISHRFEDLSLGQIITTWI
jgi:hypothetical protein